MASTRSCARRGSRNSETAGQARLFGVGGGGANFERIVPPWKSEGLLRIRNKLLRVRHERLHRIGKKWLHVRQRWFFYPEGWAADCSQYVPYGVREVVDLALKGADVSGCNEPGLADYAARVVRKQNRYRPDDVRLSWSPGPSISDSDDQVDLQEVVASLDKGLLPQIAGPWTAKQAREIRRLELALAERKSRAGKSRVVTTEFRDETTGDYGQQVKIGLGGQVVIAKNKLPVLVGAEPITDDRLTKVSERNLVAADTRLAAEAEVTATDLRPRDRRAKSAAKRKREQQLRVEQHIITVSTGEMHEPVRKRKLRINPVRLDGGKGATRQRTSG